MAENLNIVSAQKKPTLSPPSKMGKTIDKKFGSELGKVGLNMKDMSEEAGGKDYSLKKKIFNLAKAETMIMQDEYLTGIYNEMKGAEGSAKSEFGYHWNEVIINLIFNKYILDNQAYLQKYKNTTAYEKKRRGEEGAQELEKNVQDKINTDKTNGVSPDFGRGEKASDVAKKGIHTDKIMNNPADNMTQEQPKDVNELFGFGKPAPLTTHKPSENDMYLVDKNSNTAVGVISPNLSQQQNMETSNKFGDQGKYERMSWYSAIQKGAKNVPPMTPEMQAKFADNKYTTNAYSGMPSYGALREDGVENTAYVNDPIVNKVADELVKVSGNINDMLSKLHGIIRQYNITDSEEIQAIISIATMKLKEKGIVPETTGASSSGQFTQGLDMPRKDDPIIDTTYQNELNVPALDINETTTTAGPGGGSSGTGQYSGPSAWAKNTKNQRFAHAPAWKGGEILQESIMKSDVNYLTNPEGFKRYARLVESVKAVEQAIEECDCADQQQRPVRNPNDAMASFSKLGEASLQDDAKNLLMKLQQLGQENPDLAQLPAFSELLNDVKTNMTSPLPQSTPIATKPLPTTDTSSQWKTQMREWVQEGMGMNGESDSVKKHAQDILRRLNSQISSNPELQNNPDVKASLDAWNNAYQTGTFDAVVKLMDQPNAPINEDPSFKGAMEKDLKNTGNNVSSKEDESDLESQDGLFKGKWNLNEDAPALTVDGLVDWAGKNMTNGADPSQAITAFAQQNNVSIEQLKDKAKLYATNAGLGLVPNGANIKDVLMGLVSQIDKMLGTVPQQNTVRPQPVEEKSVSQAQQRFMGMVHADKEGKLDNPSPEVARAAASMTDKAADDFASTKHKGLPEKVKTNEMAPEIDNQTHFGDLKTQSLRKKIRVSELLALAQSQPDLAAIQQFADSKGITVDKLVELADQYLRNNLGYDDMIQTGEQRALVDLIDAATPQEAEPIAHDGGMDQLAGQDVVAEGNDNDPSLLLQLGKVMFGTVNPQANEADLIEIAKSAMDKFFKGKTVQQAIQLMNDKLKPMGLANEGMMDDQPDSMVNVSDTSMANTSDSPELNSSGMGSDGDTASGDSDSSTSIDDLTEGRPYAGKELKQKTFKAKDKQEAKKEIKDNLKQEKMNEEKKTPSMLNLDDIKKQNAQIANKEMASADALQQSKTYPDTENFYIEQDKDKIQEFKTAEELEKEALAKIKPKDEALHNDGNSTNDGGNSITKRNLSKEEMTKLAMDRGDGMHNIVYDNEPSKKFEDRLKRDMGEDLYKLRQDKLKEKQAMPMYNKDTQPTEKGETKNQPDKFRTGFNESYMGKYVDDFGKSQFVEFAIDDVKEVHNVNEGFKLNLEGLGNKYTQKVNENKEFGNIIAEFDFYLLEDLKTVVKVKNDINVSKAINESVDKMARLIGYNTKDYVNAKKSVKF